MTLERRDCTRVEVVQFDRVVLAFVEPVEEILPRAVLEDEEKPVVRFVGLRSIR